MSVLDKFLTYVSYETTAKEERDDGPSNDLMFHLAQHVLLELQQLHPDEISINQFGIVDAKFYGKSDKDMVAFIAHMDTAPACSGKDVKPRVVDYDGKDVELQESMYLSEKEFPMLAWSRGHKIIVTDGNTLLGGDDKAGMAIIMEALEKILKGDENHRSLEIIFTTDEEIGADAKHVSLETVKAKYGYTVDGGDYRAPSIETFSAYAMTVKVKGKSIHPGSAKDQMVNAINVLMNFHSALPEFLRPEHTDEKEPFYHILDISGCEEEAKGEYIIRSFDDHQVQEMISLAKLTARRINQRIGYEAISLSFQEQYHNMKVIMDQHPEIQKEMEEAMKSCDIPVIYLPIRGGTTGSQLSFMGLPTPNLGTGDYNMHGRYEYVDLYQMEALVGVVYQLMKA